MPAKNPKVWRALDFGGVIVEIEYPTHRVVCPEHGVVTAAVPWAYPGFFSGKRGFSIISSIYNQKSLDYHDFQMSNVEKMWIHT